MSTTWASLDGTIYDNEELSKEARMIPHLMMVMKDAVEPASEFLLGKNSGDKVGFRLYGRIPLSSADTAIQETEKVPFGEVPTFHGTGTVFRRAFAVPWTGTREDLDRLDTEAPIVRALRDHAARVENKVIYDQAVSGRSFTFVADDSATDKYTFANDGTVAETADLPFSLLQARKLKFEATRNNIPTFDGSNWLFIGSPQIEDDLNSDVTSQGWVDVAKYAPSGAEGALRGEIGRVQRMRFAIDNDIVADDVGSNNLGSGFLFGEDAIKEMMVYPMHFRVNMNVGDDFGNNKAIAWQSFVDYVVPWNYTSHGDGRIIHYTSA